MIDRLSFDILFQVFDHYTELETVEYPLETILLVSRTWNEAASTYRALWGRINVNLTNESDLHMWKIRLPLRLQRSGGTPLHIQLRYAGNWFYNGWRFSPDKYHDYKILDILAGPSGEHCKRWKTLRLELGLLPFHTFSTNSRIFSLTYPTPSLVALLIHRTRIIGSNGILPQCPSLVQADFYNCKMSNLSDIRTCRTVKMGWTMDLPFDRAIFSDLEKAVGLEELTLSVPSEVLKLRIPLLLRHLISLELYGNHCVATLLLLHTPNLQTLSLSPQVIESTPSILECRGIPFGRLETLKLCPGEPITTSLLPGIDNLLHSTPSIKYIHIDDRSISPLISILQADNRVDTSERLFATSEFVISTESRDVTIPPGVEDRGSALDSLMKQVGVQ